jgi:hypothetical protein
MGATPDPVAEAAEYQRFLLAMLGDDDPADVQAATPEALRAIFRDAGDRLRARLVPGEWSALETTGHMLDAEVIASARYRWILSEDQPRLVGYDQELWMERLRHPEEDPEELLATFEALRAANLSLWARATDEDRSRLGNHEERGPESYELTFRLIAGHDRNHLAQARDALGGLAGP